MTHGSRDKPGRPGEGPVGPNPLFFGVLGAIALGVVAAVLAGDAKVLQSNLVYRLIVGGVTTTIAYGVVAILWFAWHRLTLERLGVAGANAQAPAQQAEITARDQEVGEFLERTTEVVEDLDERLGRLEDRE